jgi:hypothetical protein
VTTVGAVLTVPPVGGGYVSVTFTFGDGHLVRKRDRWNSNF